MAAMQTIVCACGCGRKKQVRTADVKRGWGKFYNKSCKGKAQAYTHQGTTKFNKKTHRVRTVDGMQVSSTYCGFTDQEWDEIQSDAEMGWDGHKDSF